jgi:hypothetical protein
METDRATTFTLAMLFPKVSPGELCGTGSLLLDQSGIVTTYQVDRDGEDKGTKAPALSTLTCSQRHFPFQTLRYQCSQKPSTVFRSITSKSTKLVEQSLEVYTDALIVR